MFRGKSATNGEGQTGGVPFNRLGVAAEEQDRQGSRYEQEDLRVYESEVALFFHGALGGRCVGRACVKRGGGASDLSKRGRRPPVGGKEKVRRGKRKVRRLKR